MSGRFAGLRSQWQLQLMVWPAMLLLVVFSIIPMFGLIIAFQDYSPLDGFLGSPWVGLANFEAFLTDPDFYNVLLNTLAISIMKLLIGFPLEIILAIMIYQLTSHLFKRFTQTVSYLPHFLSWVILGGMVISWLATSGLLNNLLVAAGLIDKPIPFLAEPGMYWGVAVLSDIWKEVGWGTILYLAAMSAIDPTLYEAAMVDGAGFFRRIWHITLPGIQNIIVLMFVLRIGSILGSNLEQALVLQNSSNISRSEVIDLYVYHLGVTQGDFSFATAVGIFASVVSLTLLLIANFLTRRLSDGTIF